MVLPTPAPPKRPACRPSHAYGSLSNIDDLDAGLEHIQFGRLLLERWGGPVDWPAVLTGRSGKSTGSPSTFSTRPSVCGMRTMAAPVSTACMPRAEAVGGRPTARTRPFSPTAPLDLADRCHLARHPPTAAGPGCAARCRFPSYRLLMSTTGADDLVLCVPVLVLIGVATAMVLSPLSLLRLPRRPLPV